MSPPSSEPDALVAAFFGPGNGFSWDGADQPRLREWVEDLRHPTRPVFLPRLLPDGRVRWYAVARTPRQSRDLREQLSAFLGPTYTDFDGLPAVLDSTDPVEAALVGRFEAVYALTVVRRDDVVTAEALFQQLRSLLARRPPRPEGDTPAQGRLVREFDLSLREQDWDYAERLLADLRSRGQMTPLSLGWLKVRLLSARGLWREILDLPDLADLLVRTRPAAITEAIQAALYHVHLVRFEAEGHAGAAVAHFRAELALTFGPLFRTRPADPLSPAGKAAAIAAAAFAPPEPVAPAPQPEIAPPPQLIAEERARRAIDANDYDTAYPLLVACPPTVTSLGMLLVCADERADSPATAREVIAVVDAAPQDVVQAVIARKVNRRILDDLRSHITSASQPDAAPAIPTGWTDWLERLNRDGTWPKAADAARAGVREWSTAAIQDDPAEQERFVKALATGRSAVAATIVRNSLPQLLEVFLPKGIPDPRLKRVYRQLLEVLVFDDDLSAASAGTIVELATALLACGLTASGTRNEYQDLMDLLEVGSVALRVPTQFGRRAAQLLDVLAANGVHRHVDIGPLLQELAMEFRLTPGRVTDGQWALLERSCSDFGQMELYLSLRPKPQSITEEEDEDTRFRRRLDGLTVALLTMDDQIAASFLRAVGRRFPGTKFKILKEEDDSRQLRDVARNADLFIVNTFDVPHMASTPVKKYRSEENTLYPSGKTATQQVEALYLWLRTNPTSP